MPPGKVKPAGGEVRAYVTALPADSRKHLNQLRELIRAAAPAAVESISYGIPTFKIDGQRFIYCAAFKGHVSLYPMTAAIRQTFAEELKGYKMSTGTIQFPLDKPLPVPLVRRLIKARLTAMRAEKK